MATKLLSETGMMGFLDVLSQNGSSPIHMIRACCDPNVTRVKVVASLYICTSFLSILGAGSILVCSVWNKIINSPEVHPLFHLTLANFMLALTWFIGGLVWVKDSGNVSCFYVEIFGEMFLIMSFFLTVNYGINVYIRLRERTYHLDNLQFSTVSSNKLYTWLFRSLYIASWVAPILVVAPLMYKHNQLQLEQKDEPSCSRCLLLFDRPKLKNKEDISWELYDSISLISCLAPSMIVLITMYIMSERIYRKCLRRTGIHTDSQRKSMRNMRKRISLYVMVFIFCWTPALGIAISEVVRRLKDADGHYSTTGCQTYIVQSLSAPLQGFLNSIVYGWTRKSFRRAAQRNLSDETSITQGYGSLQPLTK